MVPESQDADVDGDGDGSGPGGERVLNTGASTGGAHE
jgi:hypothetical protein